MCTLCLAIPGPLVGLATSHLFNIPWSKLLQSLYDDTLVPTILTVTVHALPIAVLVAVLLGWVKVEQLVEWRGYIIVAIFIIAAIITPPDGLSQIMLALPMWALYEIGIVAARILVKSRAKADALNGNPAD